MSWQTLSTKPQSGADVHLEGSHPAGNALKLAHRNHVTLPADTVRWLRAWYKFTNFAHFIEGVFLISSCVRTPDDIE